MNAFGAGIGNRRIWAAGFVLLALFVGGSLWWWVRSGRIVTTDDARVKGTMTTVSAKVAGRARQVLVEEGDRVVAGQVLAVIEREEYENQVARAEANLAMAKARLAEVVAGNRPQEVAQAKVKAMQEKALYENARGNFERDRQLYEQQAISARQMDDARTQMESVRAQYQAAREAYDLSLEGARKETIEVQEAMVGQAQAELENARIALADAVVKAPSGGVIGQKSIELGEYVSAGKPLFNITDLDGVWIGVNIKETEIGKIALGNRAEFTIDAYPGATFTGEVVEAGPAAGAQFALLPTENSAGNFTKVTQRLPIKVRPDASSYVLKPGMSAILSVYVQ